MRLLQHLKDHVVDKALETKVACLSIGLKYTAVTTDDGGIGLAFTCSSNHRCHSKTSDYVDGEGRSAIGLLEKISDPSPLQKSIGLATVNALNYGDASRLQDDATDGDWMETFGIGGDTHVAMVGFIRPLSKKMHQKGAQVEIIDEMKGIGNKNTFYEKLNAWADVLILSSTSILNETAEDVLAQLRPQAKAIMIGPSTPLIPGAFRHLPVQMLAGTVPVNQNAVLKAIRHGEGTPIIHRYSRKVIYKFAST